MGSVAEKSVLVVAQVLGYMLAKFFGIRTIAEIARREAGRSGSSP